MPSLFSKVGLVGTILAAVFYQFIVKSLLIDILGYGRSVRSIKDFPQFQCKRIDEIGLEGCEDMWLHEPTGFLYMACSDSQSRMQWTPATDSLNASGRGLGDRIAILDTRGPGSLASRIKWISAENFSGVKGDGTLNLHGFDIRGDRNDVLQILLVNHRPPIDPTTGTFLDATVVGANSTIELFQTKVGSDTMRHIKTYSDPLIQTPNRVAWVNEHSFLYTNDHSGKVGLRRHLDPFIGGGSVGYCDGNRCNIAASSGFFFPNGLVRGLDGLIYVPSTLNLAVDVFSLNQNHLEKVNSIKVPYSIDNLSVDKNGDIYAAGIPKVYILNKSGKAPFDIHPPTAVLRIRRVGKGYEGSGRQGHLEKHGVEYGVDKIMEDDGSVLPGSTVAVHDAETGSVFMGGFLAPYIAICQSAKA